MCFYHDSDWFAEVSTEQEGGRGGESTCDECSSIIPAGEWRRTVYQQEHEACYRCREGECACEGLDEEGDAKECLGCKCAEPDYGETCDYVCCGPCANLIDAIAAAEVDEGCVGMETRPELFGLSDAMTDDRASRLRYAKRAVQMFPALTEHRFVQDAFEE